MCAASFWVTGRNWGMQRSQILTEPTDLTGFKKNNNNNKMEIKCQAKSFNCIILYILYVFQPCEHRHRPMLVISWSGELRPILANERLSLYPVMMPSTCYQLTYIPTSFVASVPTLESVAGIKFRIGIYYKNQWCWLSRYEATLKRAVKIVEWCNHH